MPVPADTLVADVLSRTAGCAAVTLTCMAKGNIRCASSCCGVCCLQQLEFFAHSSVQQRGVLS